MQVSKILISLVVVGTSLYASTQTLADTNTTVRTAKLDEVVVTATGFEGALGDETRNVSVITAEEMQNRGYRDLREILEKAPGVSFNGATVDLRGQGQKANTSVKVLLNGVALNMIDTTPTTIPIDLVPIEDIERVEIIPGGGSVLYGSGTSGGVINIITKQKTTAPYASVSTKFGSYGYKDIVLGVGTNVTDDLFLKSTIKRFKEGSYRDEAQEGGYYTAFGLNYKISDSQSIAFNPSYYRAKTISPGVLTLDQMLQDRRQSGGNLTALKSSRINFDFNYGVKFNDKFEFNLLPYYQNIRISQDGFDMRDRKTGVNLKGRYDYGSGEFIAGYEFLKNEGYRLINFNQRISSIMQMKQLTIFDMQKLTHSVYALEKHNFTDYFSLSGGVRFERAEYNVVRDVNTNMLRMGVSMAGYPQINHLDEDDDKNNYSFEITPSFNYSKTGNVYFKFERGYISPGPNQLIDKVKPSGADAYQLNNLKSEKFNTYEVGVKDLIFGQFVSATLFLTDTSDEIFNDVSGSISNGWSYKNIDKTRRYGAELYAEQNLFKNLKLSQTFSYVDTQIRSGTNKGKEVPLVEKTKVVLGVDYEPIKDFIIMGDFKYFSSAYDSNYDKIDSKTVVDLGASYKFYKGFSVSAGIKNLFNEKYNYSQNKQRDTYDPAPERNYYVEFKYAY